MKSNLLLIIFTLCSSLTFSQVKLADKFFDNYSYVKASELYEKAFEKGDNSEHVLTRIGDCYYNNSNSKKAAMWYAKAVNKYDDISAQYLFKYIQSLKSTGNYTEANIWLKKFIQIQNDNSRNKDYNFDKLLSYNELNTIDDPLSIKIENLPFNSKLSDFGSYIHNNTLYFASSRGLDKTKNYGWNKEPFLDIFEVSLKDKGYQLELGNPELLKASAINSDYHEANVTITNDGKTMYFTRDNVTRKNKLNYDKKGTTHLKIYKASLVDGSWENIKELPINDEVYSTGHPSLSADNKTLYFVSDREGGFGQTDIYEVDILEKNKFSKPRNLGPNVNTEGREMFPFVSKDSTLYFSSDGRLNLGLLDIFKSNIIKDRKAEPINLGAPYNSGYDDFAYFVDPSNTKNRSYFSSNRPEGKGNDDIYTVYTKVCSQIIKGITRDKENKDILSNTSVKLIDETGKIVDQIITAEDGAYEFTLDCNKTYTIIGSKTTYTDDKVNFDTDDNDETINKQDLFLDPLIKGNQIVIKPIYFDFNKSNIRLDAGYELENIVDVLRVNPKMIIRIESHTDSRGRDNFNLKLSDRRAKSTRDYILSRGIAPERIESAIGFGESQLLNKCSNGVRCTAAEHQLNRRSYFYIVKK
ncbi:OmpA family protein [Postechiella marina]|uniref:OmpA family protein n=1 Tax=Postechiella marina TaxID=943941 RepID=A0ABP8CDW8_9FLAO